VNRQKCFRLCAQELQLVESFNSIYLMGLQQIFWRELSLVCAMPKTRMPRQPISLGWRGKQDLVRRSKTSDTTFRRAGAVYGVEAIQPPRYAISP
jgi:hypothetical protein